VQNAPNWSIPLANEAQHLHGMIRICRIELEHLRRELGNLTAFANQHCASARTADSARDGSRNAAPVVGDNEYPIESGERARYCNRRFDRHKPEASRIFVGYRLTSLRRLWLGIFPASYTRLASGVQESINCATLAFEKALHEPLEVFEHNSRITTARRRGCFASSRSRVRDWPNQQRRVNGPRSPPINHPYIRGRRLHLPRGGEIRDIYRANRAMAE